jgi:hypothetical protein
MVGHCYSMSTMAAPNFYEFVTPRKRSPVADIKRVDKALDAVEP